MNYSRNIQTVRNMRRARSRQRKIKMVCLTSFVTLLLLILSITLIAFALNYYVDDDISSGTDLYVEAAEPTATPTSKPDYIIKSLGVYEWTAYCPCMECCGKTDGITASGVKAVEGVTIAADTSILPFETTVIMDGHEYIVQDIGGAIKGNRIDLYFDSHQDALDFGRQWKEIYIKERID